MRAKTSARLKQSLSKLIAWQPPTLPISPYLWQHEPGIRNESLQALDHFLNHHFHVSQLSEVKTGQVPGILGVIKNMGKV